MIPVKDITLALPEHLCEIYESLREDVKEKLKSYVHDPDKVCVMC